MRARVHHPAIGAGIVVLLCVLAAGRAEAQGEGPRNLPLIPVGTNVFVPGTLVLSGNFNPQQTVLVPGANVHVVAVPLTYIRTFGLGDRFGRLFVTLPLATLEANAEVLDPVAGRIRAFERRRTGYMDPMVTMHIGLAGAPALTLPEFIKHPKGFQMVGILGTSIPIGTYDADRLINLGTNRWSFRTGIGTVVPFTARTQWESANSVFFFTETATCVWPTRGPRSRSSCRRTT